MTVIVALLLSFYFFFFFQAEDGIRDVAVTGVQTCALPISLLCPTPWRSPLIAPRQARLPFTPSLAALRAGSSGAAASLLPPSTRFVVTRIFKSPCPMAVLWPHLLQVATHPLIWPC